MLGPPVKSYDQIKFGQNFAIVITKRRGGPVHRDGVICWHSAFSNINYYPKDKKSRVLNMNFQYHYFCEMMECTLHIVKHKNILHKEECSQNYKEQIL